MLLKNKTALVYGAGGAVGGAVASTLTGPSDALTVDATVPTAIEANLAEAVRRHGPVNLMFNAIGWDDTQGAVLTQMPFDRFLAPVQTALTTWFHTGTIVVRHMAQHGGGTILGITANAGREPLRSVGGFGVACAAVEHFLRQLAIENGPDGVRVCWVRSPGSPDAPGVREAWELYGQSRGMTWDEVHREFAQDVPLRRVTGLAEVANAAVLLASDLAAGMTATLANATGGAQID